jgi:imidazolonepropionase-like amidohydrolase
MKCLLLFALVCVLSASAHKGYLFKSGDLSSNTIQQKTPETATLISAKILIPGDGRPITDAALVFSNDNGTILFVGSSSELSEKILNQFPKVLQKYELPVIMPGLWDAHTHFGGSAPNALPLSGGYAPNKYASFGMALKLLKEALCAGVTSVREVGNSYSQALGLLVRTGSVPGPHFYYASKAIGMTGGHTDEQYLPIAVTRHDYDTMYEGGGALCDGVPECLKKVREQIRDQADVIKVMTSGGVLSAFDQPTDMELSLEEVTAIVQEARRAGRSVAAHAHGETGIDSAIRAGILTIEHGSYLTPDLAERAKEAGMIHVPTVTIVQTFNQSQRPPEYDELQWAKGVVVMTHNSQAVRNAIAAGLTIAAGTDCPGSCALVGKEVTYFVDLFGMDPLEAIKAATAHGPLTLGGRAPKSGKLEVGHVADIIALDESPLSKESVRLLTNPQNIKYVFQSGKLVKSPENKFCADVTSPIPENMMWIPVEL